MDTRSANTANNDYSPFHIDIPQCVHNTNFEHKTGISFELSVRVISISEHYTQLWYRTIWEQ